MLPTSHDFWLLLSLSVCMLLMNFPFGKNANKLPEIPN